MSHVMPLSLSSWSSDCPAALQSTAIAALEAGKVLLLPQLGATLSNADVELIRTISATRSKNISLSPQLPGLPKGADLGPDDAQRLEHLMRRFADDTRMLLQGLFPTYRAALQMGRTSFRPVEIEGRVTAWRKDDTRLHVDSFPATPVQGKRILRVFSNVNPQGKPRTWRLGEPFEQVAARFYPTLRRPLWGSSALLRTLRLTKSRRSAYDHFMLQLHDRMKADQAYQRDADQATYDFPAGSTWVVFTDQASHAAMAGQHLLEQTFYLPVAAMQHAEQSPQRVLERLAGKVLAA